MKKLAIGAVALGGMVLTLTGCAAPRTLNVPDTHVPSASASPRISDGAIVTRSVIDSNYTGEDDTFIMPAQGFTVKISCTGDAGSKVKADVLLDNKSDQVANSATFACDGKPFIMSVKNLPTARAGKEGAVSTSPAAGNVRKVDLLVTAGA